MCNFKTGRIKQENNENQSIQKPGKEKKREKAQKKI